MVLFLEKSQGQEIKIAAEHVTVTYTVQYTQTRNNFCFDKTLILRISDTVTDYS